MSEQQILYTHISGQNKASFNYFYHPKTTYIKSINANILSSMLHVFSRLKLLKGIKYESIF